MSFSQLRFKEKVMNIEKHVMNSFNLDYFAETAEGNQLPAINVFRKTDKGIFHFYNAELLHVPSEEGQNPRHVDLIWPLWNLFDLTPEGRGIDWFPKYSY